MDGYLHFPADGVAQLPFIILELIFSFLSVKDLVISAQVCWSWKRLIDKTRFWLKIIKRDGIKLLPELEHDLIDHDAQDQVIICLKNSCKYKNNKMQTIKALCKIHEKRNCDSRDSYNDKIYWTIHEDNISVASALLIFIKPKAVCVRITQKHSEIPNLILLFKILSYCNCGVKLMDIYSWRTANSTSSDFTNILILENKRYKLTAIQGSITSLVHLPKSLNKISVALTQDDTSLNSIPGLEKLVSYEEYNPNFVISFNVHVIAGTNVSTLPPLPIVGSKNRTCLFMSNVNETYISWAVETAKSLQYPGSSYNLLLFPQNSLTADNIDKLLESLAKTNVQMTGIVVDSNVCVDAHLVNCKIKCIKLLPNCRFSVISNDEMEQLGW